MTLFGGEGNDTLFGGAGNDKMSGGLGSDIFQFKKSIEAETDTISDYSTDDLIQLFTGKDEPPLTNMDIVDGNLQFGLLTIEFENMTLTSLDQLKLDYVVI